MQKDTTPPSLPPHSGVARFMDACYRRPTDATPVWFMRQGGSCLSEYRAILQKYDVMTIAKTPELSSQVAVMPIKTFGVDAAVLYADIMLPIEGMGVSMSITPKGPVIHNPIRSLKDVAALHVTRAEEATPFVLDGIRLIRREIEGKQAIIGISGAPFTLACYMIEGGPSRDYQVAKALMYGQPEVWDALMQKITDVICDYVKAQVSAGADVIQIFDSWVGSLSPSVYRRFVLPYSQRVFAAIKQVGAPSIHFGTGTAALLEAMVEAGGDVQSVDWRINLDEAWKRIGPERGIQGNLDPTVMHTSWPTIEREMQDVLQRAAGRPGHIFNFGHAVLVPTDEDLLRRLVEAVHEATAR
ncbi:uroporphyrinogen decarboxylase [Ktedonosporobacter rubrisoli]|uniref:Uroporphyrinogen decarboxylase n=1 Tax=Ktedonosporobacter rubrisoli TaxID=2509675 RepID=A0A4P6JW63_KTERU|nr:uroporphyrinogen decarboxylase [Ktedonosporobacter rubrisoli]QBD79612.1 uroporphyrinogen decarboxylase [Ktedonosporobacter rubrisoli]